MTTVENIPLREGRAVRVGDDEIAIFNLGDRFVAMRELPARTAAGRSPTASFPAPP